MTDFELRYARKAAQDLCDDELRVYWEEFNRRTAEQHGKRIAAREAANHGTTRAQRINTRQDKIWEAAKTEKAAALLARLRYHVSGAIARGEKEAIVEIPAERIAAREGGMTKVEARAVLKRAGYSAAEIKRLEDQK